MRIAAIVGDSLVLAVLTIVGFAMHETLGAASRLVVTIGAFLVAWLWIAPWFGSFRLDVIGDPRRVWRILAAWVAAASFGSVLRGLVLGLTVSPIFVVVMTAVSGAGLLVWRVVFALWLRGRQGEATAPR